MAENGHFGHFGQSEVAENGPNQFPMPNNLGIDTRNKFLACSEPELPMWPLEWPKMAQNGHFGHFGQSEVAENGPNQFPMVNNLGIDTKKTIFGHFLC